MHSMVGDISTILTVKLKTRAFRASPSGSVFKPPSKRAGTAIEHACSLNTTNFTSPPHKALFSHLLSTPQPFTQISLALIPEYNIYSTNYPTIQPPPPRKPLPLHTTKLSITNDHLPCIPWFFPHLHPRTALPFFNKKKKKRKKTRGEKERMITPRRNINSAR